MSYEVTNRPEIWGAIEATVCRIGDGILDQLEKTGHTQRTEDLEAIRALGIHTLRYPVIWEKTERTEGKQDWGFVDTQMARMKELGMTPIISFLQYGNGPFFTNLLDPEFPKKFARFAGEFARRHAWVDAYTPINEPMTAARLCGLSGTLYPHGQDDKTFLKCLLNQCKAIVLAMGAIRRVNPLARYVHTEELGHTSSTAPLEYQAEFENELRWLAIDLILGRVDGSHPLHTYLVGHGIKEKDLVWMQENCLPIDSLGVNYRVFSDRFLDHRIFMYPQQLQSGNSRDFYIDIEAAHVEEGIYGFESMLRDAWNRYGLPLALTECYQPGSREEQMRWLDEGWSAATRLKAEGVEVKAVTASSLLGAYCVPASGDDSHCYEAGAFDIRSTELRETALADMVQELAMEGHSAHPVLTMPGWWRRADRVQYGPMPGIIDEGSIRALQSQPVLITGGNGMLAQAFARICDLRGIAYTLTTREDMDIANGDAVRKMLELMQPWAVINTAGFVRMDDAQFLPHECLRENTKGAAVLAEECQRLGIRFITFSTDQVFDGENVGTYRESDEPNPLNLYGKSKSLAEKHVHAAYPGSLIVRTGALFGPWDKASFVYTALSHMARGVPFEAAADITISPTYVPDLVQNVLDLLVDGEGGVWHLANEGIISLSDFAKVVAVGGGFEAEMVIPRPSASFRWPAQRPANSALASERAALMPSLESALERFFREAQPTWLVDTREQRTRQSEA